MKLLIPLELNLPPQVQIIGYELKTDYYGYPEIFVKFETPQFKGFINAQLYADKTTLIPQEGTITGSYKYSSKLDWLWNDFEFFFKNPEELSHVLNQILSGTPLIEEAKRRQKPPKNLAKEFLNGYGKEVVEDVQRAFLHLFGLDNKHSIFTSNSSEVTL